MTYTKTLWRKWYFAYIQVLLNTYISILNWPTKNAWISRCWFSVHDEASVPAMSVKSISHCTWLIPELPWTCIFWNIQMIADCCRIAGDSGFMVLIPKCLANQSVLSSVLQILEDLIIKHMPTGIIIHHFASYGTDSNQRTRDSEQLNTKPEVTTAEITIFYHCAFPQRKQEPGEVFTP